MTSAGMACHFWDIQAFDQPSAQKTTLSKINDLGKADWDYYGIMIKFLFREEGPTYSNNKQAICIYS
jgi:hypothetical protein